jgi:hypothetical protein
MNLLDLETVEHVKLVTLSGMSKSRFHEASRDFDQTKLPNICTVITRHPNHTDFFTIRVSCLSSISFCGYGRFSLSFEREEWKSSSF